MAKYEACSTRLQVDVEIKEKNIWEYGDSNPVINQISQKQKVKSEVWAPYYAYLVELTYHFTHITYTYLLQEDNQVVDALANQPQFLTF